jgi:cardiolipin synthase A/B
MFALCRSFHFLAPALALSAAFVACSSKHSGETPDDADSHHEAGATGDAVADAASAQILTLITEPDQTMTPIYNFVSSAKKSIDMTMYELEDSTFEGLLTTAAKNGVTVRVILDTNLEMSANTPAYNTLSAAGVQVHWAWTTYSATHQKTITIDQETSAVMTLNLSSEDYATSRDFALITNDANDVAAIETTFAADFASTAITPPTGDDLVWSPTNSESAMVGLLNAAKSTILLENEEMSDDDIISALTAAAQRGVSVEVVMVDSKDYAVDFSTLEAAGCKVVTYPSYGGLYIHAKVIVVDSATSDAKYFLGSENFSDASLTRNRELGVIRNDPAILSALATTLAKDYAGGTPYSSE